jgi:hypothetical protein
MTGHTADDQAETVLINLLRGSATRGLAGMQAGPSHPILQLRRSETHALCNELGIDLVHDASNDDERFQRNKIRQQLMPLLDAISQRDMVPVLARQAELLRDDEELLNELALAIDPTDAQMLAAAPIALARRAVRAWLAHLNDRTVPVLYASVIVKPDCPPGICCVCALHDRSDFFYAILFGTLAEQVQAGQESKNVSTHPAKRQLAKRHEQAGSREKSSGNAPNQGHEARVYEEQVPYFSGAREPFRFLEFFAGGGMARAGLAPRWASI